MQSCGQLCSWLCQSRTARTARSPRASAKAARTVVEESWENYILEKKAEEGFHSPRSSTAASCPSTPSIGCTPKAAWAVVEESWENYILVKKASWASQGFHSPGSSTAPSCPSTPSTGCSPKAVGDGRPGSTSLLQGFIRLQKEAKVFQQQVEQTPPCQDGDGRLDELLQGFIRLQKEAKVFQQQVEQTPPSKGVREVLPKVQARELLNQLKNDTMKRRKFRKLLGQWRQPEVKDTSAIFQLLQQGQEFVD
ncbi:unnamed protein product [Cladocopium goreaui]|uniref:Uncharacterized protein n=1 Tax=Cladocopium goreaui TaxID=2562237 RepID=A0A9P1CM22_9DINO|nr:unnamed protein product [Cladocopium goreaui]